MNERKHPFRIIFWIILIIFTLASCTGIFFLYQSVHTPNTTVETKNKTENKNTPAEGNKNNPVPYPSVDQQLLTINEYSRPGTKLTAIENIVIHYLGNPETTAQQNRDYFDSLKDLKNDSMSANYVIGLDGEIIHCVSDDEVAYASNEMNSYSLSIENCHIDKTGRLLRDTYVSLVKLTAYLTEEYQLERDQIIRHYDVTGKECPRIYVDDENAWETFRDDVMKYREACIDGNIPSDEELIDMLDGIGDTYRDKSEKIEWEDEEEESGHREGGIPDETYDYSYDSDYAQDDDYNSYDDGYTDYDNNYTPPDYNYDPGYQEPDYDSTPDTEPYYPPSTDAPAQTDPPATDAPVQTDPPATDAPVQTDPPATDAPVQTDPPVIEVPAGDDQSGEAAV